jgi:hypothetical protein
VLPPLNTRGCFGRRNCKVNSHERGQTRLDLLVDVGRYRRRRCRSGRTYARTGIGDGRRDADKTLGPTHFTVALPVLYLDRRSRLEVRIHGRPRSDRKKSFLLSAVAPSTSTRHPRKARPINWAQRGGLASGGKCSPDAEATFHRASCTPGNQVVRASDGPPFRQERRPTRLCRTPGAGSGLLAEAALCQLGDRVLAGDREALGVQESAFAVA